MKLSTRLSVLLIAITTLVALSVGWYAVTSSSRTQYAAIDSAIKTVMASSAGHPASGLSDALNTVQEHNLDLTLDVVDPQDSATQIASGNTPLPHPPTLVEIRAALGTIQTSVHLPGFRYLSLRLGHGDYLVVAGSTQRSAARTHQLIVNTLIVGLFAALMMWFVARLFMRPELLAFEELTSFASDIAQGHVERSIPSASGSRDLRQLQAALARMVTSLQATIEVEKRSAATMQRFIGDASHELRTPLTIVKGYAELLAHNEVPEEQRQRALERVEKEVGRMDALVGDLLFLAEVSEVRTVDDTIVNFSELVRVSARDFATDHPQRDVTTTVQANLSVAGRADYLDRLVMNALNNIGRHTAESDPARVTLRRDGARVVLSIEDGGPGLPAELYGTRLKQFQRFDPSRSRTSGGSGLGMSIMGDIATAMHGSLEISKSPLGGLALTFSFPDAGGGPSTRRAASSPRLSPP